MRRGRARSDECPGGTLPRTRRRWPFVAVTLVVVLLVGGALAIREFVRPARLTAILVDEVAARLGASLELGGDARFGVWPSLRIELPQARLRGIEAADAFLAAESIDVVIPWRSLWNDTLEIERIELDAPRLDLDALDAWLADRGQPPAAISEFSVRVLAQDASLSRGATLLASGIELDLASAGDLAAWLAADAGDPARGLLPPLAGSIEAAEARFGATRLRGVRIDIDAGGAEPAGGTAPADRPSDESVRSRDLAPPDPVPPDPDPESAQP